MLSIRDAYAHVDWFASDLIRKPVSRKNGFRIGGFGPDGKGFLIKFPRSQRVSLKEFKKENADSDFVLSSVFKAPTTRDEVLHFLDFMEDKVNAALVNNASDWVTSGVSGKGKRAQQQQQATSDPVVMMQSLLSAGQNSNYYMNDYGTLYLKASVLPTTEFYDEEGRELSMREFKEKLETAAGGQEEPSFYSCVPVLHFSHVWCDSHSRNGIKAKVAAVRLFKPTEEEVSLMSSGAVQPAEGAVSSEGVSTKRQKIGGESLV